MSAVACEGLTKTYGGDVRALDGLTLEIPRGAAFGLIGPNGAGKTTFIKLLLGIARPTAGEVRVLGRSPEDAAAREKVGYLPERLHLPAAWKPPAYLRSVATLKGLSDAPIDSLLKRVGLAGEASRRRIGGFSKGMRQRLGLAAALLGEPDLLVLDEPTDGIDPLGRIEVRELLMQEKARGATLLLNSHLLAETERVCERVGILNRGRLVKSGTLDALKAEVRGWELTFAPGFDAGALAALGLRCIEGARFAVDAETPAALNALVDEARATGALLVKLERGARDLEALLEESVR
ncbi:MAG: ABC transporter ATP-binding protein [Myxococcaceae bacterium]|nr:ABC transporter ATP-binding protein [Myxococcaceae bacterium]